MLLTIDGAPRQLLPIRDFRDAHDLPPDFGVAHFEPKDWTGLGRIDRAGAELNQVRAAMLDAIPTHMTPRSWLAFLPDYTRLFEQQLYDINPQVGLKDVEVEFAVAGLSDVCQAVAYALVRGGVNTFQAIYTDWLDSTVKIFTQIYPYTHHDHHWQIQIFAHAYGRAGLIVRTPETAYYVHDSALACPAEGFMASLLNDIAARIIASTTS